MYMTRGTHTRTLPLSRGNKKNGDMAFGFARIVLFFAQRESVRCLPHEHTDIVVCTTTSHWRAGRILVLLHHDHEHERTQQQRLILPEYGRDAHRHAGDVTREQSSGRLQPPQDGDHLLSAPAQAADNAHMRIHQLPRTAEAFKTRLRAQQ